MCEDWYHSNHLEGYDDIPNYDSENCELICHLCMSKNQFLLEYQGYMVKKITETKAVDQKDSSDSNLDIVNNSENKEELEGDTSNVVENESVCLLEKNKTMNKNLKLNETPISSCLFIDGWRSALCKCKKCLDLC